MTGFFDSLNFDFLKDFTGGKKPRKTAHPVTKTTTVESAPKAFANIPDYSSQLNDIERKLSEYESVKEVLEANNLSIQDILDANKSGMVEEIVRSFTETDKETRDYIHNENVKVYRNVQAVVVDETAKLGKSISKCVKTTAKKNSLAVIFSILAFSFSLLNMVMLVLIAFGVF